MKRGDLDQGMKHQTRLLTAIATIVSCPAWAGGLTVPVIDQPISVQPVAVIAPLDWAGGYVGGNLGYGTAEIEAQDILALQTDALGISRTLFKPDGLTAGLRGGYDWQRGQFVFGLGGEYTLGDRDSGLEDADTAATLSNPTATLSEVGRVFGRVGYATGPWLPYALLGYSTAKLEISGPDGGEGDIEGVTAGIGVERRFMGNFSGYGEYSYTDFGDVAGADDQISVDLNEIRLGVNYRF